MNKDELAKQIKSQLADADIRTDQCDTVRIYWRGRVSFIKELADSEIEVTIRLRPAPDTPDLLPYPLLKETAFDEQEAAELDRRR